MLKKILIIITSLIFVVMVTGCDNNKHNIEDILSVLNKTSKITSYKESIILNYAVDDNSITATGEIKHDIINKISSGKFHINFNEDIYDIDIYEYDNKTYISDKNQNLYYMNISLQELEQELQKNIQKDTLDYINIKADRDNNLESYRYDIKASDKLNEILKIIGNVFYKKEFNEIKKINKINIQKGLNFKDGYAYKTEINLKQILESNLVDDTSVIGVATITSNISTLKDTVEVNIDNLNSAQELTNIKEIADNYVDKEVK